MNMFANGVPAFPFINLKNPNLFSNGSRTTGSSYTNLVFLVFFGFVIIL